MPTPMEVFRVELDADDKVSPEKAAELADELGRRLAMAGVRDEERRIAEQAFAKALEGFDASNAAATVLPVAQRGLERALDSIGVLTDTLLGVAKLSPAGPNVFACGRAAQAIGTAIVLLEQALDIGVSIVDLNDFGGSIRAVSPRSLSAETLAAILSDNPLGQHRRSTPFVLVRPA